MTFTGIAFLNRRMMLEYVAEPPIDPGHAPTFATEAGPGLVVLAARDDVSESDYPIGTEATWGQLGRGRIATPIDGRPPPEASRLWIDVFEAKTSGRPGWAEAGPHLTTLEIALPVDHAAVRRPPVR